MRRYVTDATSTYTDLAIIIMAIPETYIQAIFMLRILYHDLSLLL